MARRALALAVTLCACSSPAAPSPQNDAGGAPVPLVIEATGRVEPQTGGVVAVRWDEGRYVYASVPGEAVRSRCSLDLVITDVGDSYTVRFDPERLVLERPLELRLEVEDADAVWRVRDGSSASGRAIPGAVVLEVTDLSEVFEVWMGEAR